MLNAHHDTHVDESENVQSYMYEGDANKWKARGKLKIPIAITRTCIHCNKKMNLSCWSGWSWLF